MPIGRREILASITALLSGGMHGRRALAEQRGAPGAGDPQIVAALKKVGLPKNVPGLTAGIANPGRRARVGAIGVRKMGAPEAFGAGDVVHLGSCTKAMTATMIATLVEEGKLSWSSTLGEVFRDVEMDEGFRGVKPTHLLTHRAGLPANADWWNLGKGTTTEQRRVALKAAVGKAPMSKPGETFAYSNLGYAIAGLMAETVMKISWEQLMRTRLFGPLKMTTAGFGPPGTKGKVDQPWGHTLESGKSKPNQLDNAAALGPAGIVHCSMVDWAKFLDLHLQGARGEKTPILKPESFRTLQTPPPGGDYALGWVVTDRPWAGGPVLMHNGSNTYWFCVTWLAPKKNFALFSAANEGSDVASKLTDGAVAATIGLAG